MLEIRKKPKTWQFLISFIFVGLLVVPNFAFSISFGAFPKKDVINVNPGAKGKFEILFYSRSEYPTQFQLTLKEYSEGFVVAYPKSFSSDSESMKDEYVLISNEYVKGKVAEIEVTVPIDAKAGEYKILLTAISSEQKSTGSLLNVNAEKTFLLKINVGEVASGSSEEVADRGIGGVKINETASTKEAIGSGLGHETTPSSDESRSQTSQTVEGSKPPFTNPFTGLLTYLFVNKFLFISIVVIIFISILIVVYPTHKIQ